MLKRNLHRLAVDIDPMAGTHTIWNKLRNCLMRQVAMLLIKDYTERIQLFNNSLDLNDELSPCSSGISAESPKAVDLPHG